MHAYSWIKHSQSVTSKRIKVKMRCIWTEQPTKRLWHFPSKVLIFETQVPPLLLHWNIHQESQWDESLFGNGILSTGNVLLPVGGLKACLFMTVFWWCHDCTVLGVFLFRQYLNLIKEHQLQCSQFKKKTNQSQFLFKSMFNFF